MKNTTTLVGIWILILLFPLISYGINNSTSKEGEDPFKDRREAWDGKLHKTSIWLIEQGLNAYNEIGKEAFNKRIRGDFLVSPYIPSYTERNHDYSAFGIVLGGTYFDVSCFYREEKEGHIYELWTIHTSNDPIRQKPDEIIFFFCRTNGFYDKRVIELETENFQSQYLFSNGYNFNLPLDDKTVMDRILAPKE